MNRVLLLFPLVALFACNSPRRGHTIRVAGCVEGRVAPCTCSSGISGTQICLADNQFTACDCPEVSGDGGVDEDAGFDQDGGFIPDKDAGLDGSIDTGVPDTGFDSGVPDTGFDSGVPDTGFDSGVPDTGFDSGVPDTGFPQLDGGFNLDGGIPIPDGGIPLPDGGLGGLCQLLPELGASCTQDVDCNTIIPFGLLFCRGNVCVEGCLCDNGPVCQSPLTCDPASGRCI